MTLVVDTSIVVRLLAARSHDDLLRRRLAPTVHAPHLIDAEVSSAVRGLAITTKPETRISLSRAKEMLADYGDLRIVRHPMRPYHQRVLELRNNFTSYDAFYIALAETLSLPLLTDDQKYYSAPPDLHQATIETYPN